VRLLQDRVEHRREVAGRCIDDAKHLGGRGFSSQRLVPLVPALGKLTFEIGYTLFGIGQRAVGRLTHLRTSSGPIFERIIS
jgi:hypothetical protein